MEFSARYTTDSLDKDATKKLISVDAYALGDVIQELINAIYKLKGAL